MKIFNSLDSFSKKVFVFIKIFFVAFCLNIVMLPTESVDLGVSLALIIRLFAWMLLVVLAVIYLRQESILPIKGLIIVIGYLLMFFVANYDNDHISTKWMVFVFANILGSLIVQVSVLSSDEFKEIIIKAINFIIILWVTFFVLQAGVFFISGQVVDFHHLFIPYSEQRFEFISGGFARLGGLHIEPGTYTQWTYGLLLIRVLYIGKIFDSLSMIAIFSIPLTLSFWAILVFIFFIGAFAIEGRWLTVRSIIYLIMLCTIVIFLSVQFDIYDVLSDYIDVRMSQSDGSSQNKIVSYEMFFQNLNEYISLGKNYDYSYCVFCWSEQDAGIFINTIVKVGGVWTLIMFTLFYWGVFQRLGVAGILFSLPVLIAKWFYWDQVFWMALMAATCYPKVSKSSRTLPKGSLAYR